MIERLYLMMIGHATDCNKGPVIEIVSIIIIMFEYSNYISFYLNLKLVIKR